MSAFKIGITLAADDVIRRLDKLQKRTRVVAYQELNRQRKQSRTRITKAFVPVSGIKGVKGSTPRQRVFGRMLLPKTGGASAKRLESVGINLSAIWPRRYWPDTLPAGAIERPSYRTKAPTYVDCDTLLFPIRDNVLDGLAREFPPRWDKRMQKEINKIFK